MASTETFDKPAVDSQILEDKIKLNCQQDVVACHRKMLQAWLNTGSASWLVLSNALMSPLVHKKGLADEIAKNHPLQKKELKLRPIFADEARRNNKQDYVKMSELHSLLTRFKLCEPSLDVHCMDDLFLSLGKQIPSFEVAAPYFGFTPPEIEELRCEYDKERSRKLHMLWSWKRKNGSCATYLAIVKIFLQMEDKQLAEHVLRKFSEKQVLSSTDCHLNPARVVKHDSLNHPAMNQYGLQKSGVSQKRYTVDGVTQQTSNDAVCHVFYKPTMIKNKWIVIIAVINPNLHVPEYMTSEYNDCEPGQKLNITLVGSTFTLQLPDRWSSDWSVENHTPNELLQADVLDGITFKMTLSSELSAPLPLELAMTLKGAQPPCNTVIVQRFADVVLTPKVLERWISQGFVDLHITKLNIHGAPKTGKTSSLHLLLGEPPPANYNSTDIARAITAVRISVENDKTSERWKRTDHIKTFEQKAKVKGTTRHQLDTPVCSIPEISGPQSLEEQQPSSDVSIKQTPSALSSDPLFGAHWIHSIDSGGQPAFLDLLPLFVQSGSINIITQNLSEELKSQPQFKYSVNGKEVSLPQHCRLTNQELVELFLRSLSYVTPICFEGIIEAPPYSHSLILGTYLDEAGSCLETLECKNEILGKALEEYDSMIISNDNNIIFEVNTQMPMGEERDQKASQLRKAIAGTFMKVKMPQKIFQFEIEISKLSKEKKEDIIRLEDCYRIGESLGMTKDDVRVGLHFLHFVSVIFYLPQFLPNIIFVSPQPLIGLLSKLVSASFVKISEVFNNFCLTKHQATQLQRNGLFSKDLLYQLSSSSAFNYFTIDQYIQLLKHLLVITPIDDIDDTTYFIPCVLPTAPLTENQKCSFLREGDADPFIIMWEKKGIHDEIAPIPLGLFPATVAAILTHSNNHRFVLPKPTDDFPHQLRNAVRLKCDTLGGFLLLVDNHKWLELYYRGDRNDCPRVREVVIRATGIAQSNLKYDTERVSIRYGFLCSFCQSNRYKRDHPSKAIEKSWNLSFNIMCSIAEDSRHPLESEICWLSGLVRSGFVCQSESGSGTNKVDPLSSLLRMWPWHNCPIVHKSRFPQDMGIRIEIELRKRFDMSRVLCKIIVDVTVLNMDDLNMIIDEMQKDHITRSQWKCFSHHLGIENSTLHYIEKMYRGDEDRILFHVLVDWIRGNGQREPTLHNLEKALISITAYTVSSTIRSNVYSARTDTAVEKYMRSSEYERDIIALQSSSDDSYSDSDAEDDSEDDIYNSPYWPTASPDRLGKQSIEDLSSESQSTDAEKFEAPKIIKENETTVEGEEEVDETGLEEKDIEHQSNASRSKAVKALRT